MIFEHYVTLEVAVEKTGIAENEIIQLAEDGKIEFAWLCNSSLEIGEMIIKYEDVERLQITVDLFEKEFGDQLISLSEASRILRIPKTTIEGWVKMGILKKVPVDLLAQKPRMEEQLINDRRRKYLLRLADVAYAKAVHPYRKRGQKDSVDL